MEKIQYSFKYFKLFYYYSYNRDGTIKRIIMTKKGVEAAKKFYIKPDKLTIKRLNVKNWLFKKIDCILS